MKFLVPVDGVTRAQVVLPTCRELANGHEATIVLFRVLSLPGESDGDAIEALEELVVEGAPFRDAGMETVEMVAHGDPTEEILRFAEELNVDAIVVSAPRGGLTKGKPIVLEALSGRSDRPLISIVVPEAAASVAASTV